MAILGFNLQKGELHFCLMEGTRANPRYLMHDRHRFEVDQPKPEMANFFKQTFNELIEARQPQGLAYRLSMDGKKADQIAYLTFPFGILSLVAYERKLAVAQSTIHTFTKKALAHTGDKFTACDERIADCPAAWPNAAKLAALAAWMSL
ncbi:MULTISPECIES: hypothetical protein [Rhizobium]|uniref:hypothetical protein n=1 Tax=Rhizobium TaxID=379 RepID=UPI001C9156C2|nr:MULTISPECIES: hypothetical protein [Rhizobium]MBY3206886.1 hypothetical protein [Rhizobium laguerreae]MDC9835714.1 hypothetical protein [Rhizobium sp. MJ37]